MLVGIDSITDEGVLESLWKPHTSKERNFLHRGYTPKKKFNFFQKKIGDREKIFEKNIFIKNFKKNLKFSKSTKIRISKISWHFSILRISWFCWNFRKLPTIFRKKNWTEKKYFCRSWIFFKMVITWTFRFLVMVYNR